jgi:CheY-like chemotaxis protein
VTAKRILVVEDEAIITADLRSKVERLGYVVCGTAFSGEDAVQKADDTAPDLVLMDIRLRGNMTGSSVADSKTPKRAGDLHHGVCRRSSRDR